MIVHKILRPAEWAEFETTGGFIGSADDRRDGFIHLSAGDQLDGTLARHFAGATGLMRIDLDAAALGDDLRWEVSRGGARFPHLYRPLVRADVIAVSPATAPPSPA